MDGKWPKLHQVNPDLPQHVHVCVCVTAAHLCGLLRAPLCLRPPILTHILSGQHWEHSGSGDCVCARVCACLWVSVHDGASLRRANTHKKISTKSFSWCHQWIVNTVLTMAWWPLATTYWIRYVTFDMASIWNPFVMQYSGELHVEVKTQSWVIERS